MGKQNDGKLLEQKVTYTLIKGEKLYVIENVPAQVDGETGEQFFLPDTVERLRKIISEKKTPSRFIKTPVYEFR